MLWCWLPGVWQRSDWWHHPGDGLGSWVQPSAKWKLLLPAQPLKAR